MVYMKILHILAMCIKFRFIGFEQNPEKNFFLPGIFLNPNVAADYDKKNLSARKHQLCSIF